MTVRKTGGNIAHSSYSVYMTGVTYDHARVCSPVVVRAVWVRNGGLIVRWSSTASHEEGSSTSLSRCRSLWNSFTQSCLRFYFARYIKSHWHFNFGTVSLRQRALGENSPQK